MLEDVRSLPDGTKIRADICIIGSGAAGISLALAFAGFPIRICVVESGGLTFDRRTQKLYRGINSGVEYEPLDLCRVRGYGGSTGPKGWGGWCKPLSRMDFEARSWVPLSGWPIDLEALLPYYPKARASLGFIEDELIDPNGTLESDGLLHLGKTRLSNEICPLSPTPDLGTASLERLQVVENIRVLLHANATRIATNAAATRANGVHVATLEKQTFFVEADYIVMAAGGLENARLLLLSNQTQLEGLGNGSDFVGRCFMEHPRFAWGSLDGRALRNKLWRYDPGVVVRRRKLQDARKRAAFGVGLVMNAETQRKEQVLGARSWIVPISDAGESEGAKELKELVFWLKKKRVPSNLSQRLTRIVGDFGNAGQTVASHLFGLGSSEKYQFITVLEQSPNINSRLTLDPSRDSLGLNRARLEWQLTELETLTLERNRAAIVEDLRALGLSCLDPDHPRTGDQSPKWVWHHIGTTRMSADPRQGVVDANCRVHSVENLYIAGSSVFPTGGNDMPTLTVVALAHRLADHLKRRILFRGSSKPAPSIGARSKLSLRIAARSAFDPKLADFSLAPH